jgi:ribosome-binding factor A
MTVDRSQRFNSLLIREINNIFLKELDLSEIGLVTITRVETSGNLIEAKVYVSVIPESRIDDVFRVLNRNIYDIQQIVNKRLRTRPIPKIIFKKENKTSEAGKIEDILEKIKIQKQ